MKNLSNLLILLITTLALQSCLNVNDEVWIESNGSGRMESTTDLSSLYPFMMMGLQQEAVEDMEGEEASGDPFKDMMQGLMAAEEVDTTFEFSSMINSALEKEGLTLDMMMDSLQNSSDADLSGAQKEAVMGMFEQLSDMSLRMQVNKASSLFKTTNIQNFNSIQDMFSMGDMMTEIMELIGNEGGDSPFGQGGEMDAIMEQLFGAQTAMDLDGNVLRVRRAGIDLSVLGEEFQQNFAMVKMFLGNDPYRLTIHFPGKVKKISSTVAKKIDKNTVMLEMPLDDLFDPEKSIDVEIQFKGLKR